MIFLRAWTWQTTSLVCHHSAIWVHVAEWLEQYTYCNGVTFTQYHGYHVSTHIPLAIQLVNNVQLTVFALFNACSVSCSIRLYLLYSVFKISCLFKLTPINFFTMEMSASILFCLIVNCSFVAWAFDIDLRKPSSSVSIVLILCCWRLVEAREKKK